MTQRKKTGKDKPSSGSQTGLPVDEALRIERSESDHVRLDKQGKVVRFVDLLKDFKDFTSGESALELLTLQERPLDLFPTLSGPDERLGTLAIPSSHARREQIANAATVGKECAE